MLRAHFVRRLVALAAIACAAGLSAQTRIACLGDSITFGARIEDRRHASYPAWLDDFLGDDFEVRNFGVGGATMLRAADRPYHATEAFAQALAWRPDIAIVILGTNDTCEDQRRGNWRHADALAEDTAELVASLQACRPGIRVVLGSPPAMFPEQRGLAPERAADLQARAARLPKVAVALQRVASRTEHVEYLELRTTLRAGEVRDGVHPTPFGAERIARRVAEAVRTERLPAAATGEALRRRLTSRAIDFASDQFHGFDAIRFELPATGAPCRVVVPHGAARGVPWILRARFFGHQPALDLALLERGFHLVYCDVAGLYGSRPALARWDELYALLVAADFEDRVVLEGMSRGGLPIVNWAVAHPQRVAAIYGDNPVVDIRSWPGGDSGKRSDADWQRCREAYGWTEQSARRFEPVSAAQLRPLAAAGVPLLLVLGTADEVVPVAENGDVLAAGYRAAGGDVEVWRKPGSGHHPHGLDPVDPLLRAVLRATGRGQGIATTPAPSVEHRSGAGWHGDSWRTQVDKMRALARRHPDTALVFFGDSITQGLTGSRERLARPDGRRALDRVFGDVGAISLGLSGDRTEHLLFRIGHGALQELKPRVIVLQIGVNNVVTGRHTASEVLAGIRAVSARLTASEPSATVLCCGPFPAGRRGSRERITIDRIHAGLAAIDDLGDRFRYLDLRALFVDGDGACNDNMRGDRIHVTAAGQRAWLQALRPEVDELLGGR